MELTAKQNKGDADQVELWSSDSNRDYLAGTIHIDNFTGPVNERINEGHPVKLHIEIAQPKAYEILEALSEEGFDGLGREERDDAVEDIKRCLADLAYNGWSYDDMARGIAE